MSDDAGEKRPYQLVDQHGRRLTGTDGFLLPHARSFQAVLNGVSRTYATRFDEALRAGKADALALRRDAFYTSLIQERVTPTANLGYSLMVEDESDPGARRARDRAAKVLGRVPRFGAMLEQLLDAVWDGRAGVQVRPECAPDGLWGVGDWTPVNGDKIQATWDRTPVILLNSAAAAAHEERYPGSTTSTDGTARGVVLSRPEWRERFVIHRHRVIDADFTEPQSAGAVAGVGYRHYCQWAAWMRAEAATWMLGFLDSVGMMDVMLFNYPSGDAAAQRRAEDNAAAISGKVALACPRGANESYSAVETVSASPAGLTALKDLIQGYYERHIERSIVGQTLSASSEGGGLGGSGVASFHRDTKYQLTKLDARKLSETLTSDLLRPIVRWNDPGFRGRIWLELAVPDPEAAAKLEAGARLVQMGASVKKSELYRLAGFTVPSEGDDVVGGPKPPEPGAPPQGAGAPQEPPEPPGAGGQESGGGMEDVADLFSAEVYAELYLSLESNYEPHTLKRGPRRGTLVYKNKATGELVDELPPGELLKSGARAAAAVPGAVKGAAQDASDWAGAGLRVSPAGRAVLQAAWAVKALGKGAHHALLYAMHKSGELAAEAASERGMDPEAKQKLQRVLGYADFAGGYIPAIAGGLAFGPLGAKAGSLLPTASVAYLAYSTARDPKATWRAAVTVAKRTAGLVPRPEGAELHALDPAHADAVADALHALPPGRREWFVALYTAGLGVGLPPADALAMAANAGIEPDALRPDSDALHLDSDPDLYGAAWTEFTHKSGKQAWKSPGGVVRFYDPSKGKPANAATAATPKPVSQAPSVQTGSAATPQNTKPQKKQTPAPAVPKIAKPAAPKVKPPTATQQKKLAARQALAAAAAKIRAGGTLDAAEQAALKIHLANSTVGEVKAFNASIGAFAKGTSKGILAGHALTWSAGARPLPAQLPSPPAGAAPAPAGTSRQTKTLAAAGPAPTPPARTPKSGAKAKIDAGDRAGLEAAVGGVIHQFAGGDALKAYCNGDTGAIHKAIRRQLDPSVTYTDVDRALKNVAARQATTVLPPLFNPYRAKNAPNAALPDAARPALSADEAVAAQKYTSSAYRSLNAGLRGLGTHDATDQKLHGDLTSAFAKAKDFPSPVKVFRSVNLSPADLNAMVGRLQSDGKGGKLTTLPGYTSTMVGAPDPFFKGNLHFTIAAKSGLDLKPHTHFPHTGELLLDHNSQFRAKSAVKKADGWHVELEHVGTAPPGFSPPAKPTPLAAAPPAAKTPKAPKIARAAPHLGAAPLAAGDAAKLFASSPVFAKLAADTKTANRIWGNADNWTMNEDEVLTALSKETGHDGAPTLVSKDQMDSLQKQGYTVAYRGVGQEKFHDQFRSGKFRSGSGVFGAGTYTAVSHRGAHFQGVPYKAGDDSRGGRGDLNARNFAKGYGQHVTRFAIAPDAKVGHIDAIKKEKRADLAHLDDELTAGRLTRPQHAALRAAMSDTGRYAMMKGYDAFITDFHDSMVMLNRSKLHIQQDAA